MNLFIVTGYTKGLGAVFVERIARQTDNEIIALGRAADYRSLGTVEFLVEGDRVVFRRDWDEEVDRKFV